LAGTQLRAAGTGCLLRLLRNCRRIHVLITYYIVAVWFCP
jgi:hypothetical protein